MPNEKGECRREYYERVGEIAPLKYIPDEGFYLWEWYWQISDGVQRVHDGVCRPLSPAEFLAWEAFSGNIVNRYERECLRAMDAAFREEMNKELDDFRERQDAKRKAEMEAAKAKAKSGRR